MNRMVAKRMRNGTSRSKSAAGVDRRRIAPSAPPITLEIESHFNLGATCPNSDRNPQMLPREPGQIATVLVALAVIDGSPSQTSAGKEINVPPPATELTPPARKAAVAAIMTRESSVDVMLNELIAGTLPPTLPLVQVRSRSRVGAANKNRLDRAKDRGVVLKHGRRTPEIN